MNVYRSFEELPKIKNAIVTQGTFDGVHAAHAVILNRLKEIAIENNGETLVMTFDPHPRMVLFPNDTSLKLLQTPDEKIESLDKAGIDNLLVIPFTKKFSEQSSLQFINDIIVGKMGAKILVIGFNHRFGKNREGSFEHLVNYSRQYGFEVVEIPQQEINEMAVSSTQIRKALESGDIKTANKYLGRNYSINGKVVHGKHLGNKIGFPTANIFVNDKNKLIPANGVYAVRVFLGNKNYWGMLNSGFRPTVDGLNYSIEVNIFDFGEDIYNQDMRVEYVEKMRNEIRFDTINQLKFQLEKDKLHATEILSSTN